MNTVIVNNLIYDSRVKNSDNLKLMLESYHTLECAIGTAFSNKSTEIHNNIPSRLLKFIVTLKQIRKNYKVNKFLDIGCGTGVKCWIAKKLGFDAHGIDLNANYCEIAKQMDVNVKCVNAFEFDGYNEFDLIYWYLPLRKPEQEIELEKKIFTEAKDSAILFPASNWVPFQNSEDLGWGSKELKDVKIFFKSRYHQ